MKRSRRIGILLVVSLSSFSGAKGQTRQLLPEEQNTVDVFRNASPAVVHINAQQRLALKFEDITPKSGIGTGFFFDQEGHILTNFHVIEGSNQLEVVLNDGRRMKALLLGTAPGLDLAVLGVTPPPAEIAPLRFGDSNSLLIGQKVLAVGHPLALHDTLTTGVVSALNRTLDFLSPELEEAVIQTDAAINPGNSGGPLLNSRGEVVGIVTATMGEAQNLGFAIPANFAKRAVPDLLSMGHAYRPALGFTGQPLQRYLAEMFGLPIEEGFLVEEVAFRSPAEVAGLRPGKRAVTVAEGSVVVLGGDIITAVNSAKVRTMGDIARSIMRGRPGDKIAFTIYRDGRLLTIDFLLEPMH